MVLGQEWLSSGWPPLHMYHGSLERERERGRVWGGGKERGRKGEVEGVGREEGEVEGLGRREGGREGGKVSEGKVNTTQLEYQTKHVDFIDVDLHVYTCM